MFLRLARSSFSASTVASKARKAEEETKDHNPRSITTTG